MIGVRPIMGRLIGPLFSYLVRVIAYGAWGPGAHRLFIRIFCSLYKIEARNIENYRRLGDFFLRDEMIKVGKSELVSPVEANVLTQALPVTTIDSLTVKGLEYRWKDFAELKSEKVQNFYFWNLYLAPSFYHWVHFPCDLQKLECLYAPGQHFPVNSLGQKLCPFLYNANERFSYRGYSPSLGRVYLMCVGAIGVSSFELPFSVGRRVPNKWTALHRSVNKSEKALGFRLGSSVLLLVEKLPSKATVDSNKLSCGQDLLFS